MIHIPVLLKEVLEYLDVKPGEVVVDGTFGFGGHAKEILAKVGDGRVIGIEKDPEIYKLAKENFKQENLTLVNDGFENLSSILENLGVKKIDGILLDLGISSYHFDESEKGFSLKRDEPLDMRLSETGPTAADLVNGLSRDELANLIYTLSDEGMSRQIAKAIVESRRTGKIKTTFELAEIVSAVKRTKGKIHPATKTFQALRIAVNDELGALKKVLAEAIERLNKGGRIVIISFHSGEDRIVKNAFKNFVKESAVEILTKKPVLPTFGETKENPRSRSARFRSARKI